MNTKNFNTLNAILVILIILGVASASGIAYYYYVPKETPSAPTANQSANQPTVPITTTSKPTASQAASFSAIAEIVWPNNQQLNMASTPTPNSTISSASPTLNQSSSMTGEILNTYSRSYSAASQKAQKNKDFYKEVSFKATIYQPLPLRDFVNGLDIQIQSTVYQYLDQTNYRAVFCHREPNIVDKGFIFKFRQPAQVADYRKIYDDVGAGLRSWEKTIFSDLKNAFFPNNEFGATPQFQETSYVSKSGTTNYKIRYAEIKDKNNNKLFIGYASQSERIFLADSLSCLQKILDAHEITPEKFR
jgi:hypothetical protein